MAASTSNSTIIFQTNDCSILDYPKWLKVKLVRTPHRLQDQCTSSDAKVPTELTAMKCRKSRKRHQHQLNKGEELQLEYHLKICAFIISCHETLIEVAKKINYFPVTDSNPSSEYQAQSSLVDLATLCNVDNMANFNDYLEGCKLEVLNITKSKDITDANILLGRMINNIEQDNLCIKCWDRTFLVPSKSSFLLSDISKIHLLAQDTSKYNLIVIDPPWENRSAIRGKKYQWLDHDDILQLPIVQLSSDHCIVAVWVTNKQRLVEWVKHALFPHWSVQFESEWFWLKVTTDGKFVFDLDSPHKKPYEILLIGRKNPSITVSCQPEYENNVKSDINEPICKKSCHVIEGTVTIMKSTPNTTVLPRHHSFMCIPSTVHSQKPYVGDLLKQYIDEPVRGLELFARNLTPGWTSWGNEVLKFQVVS